MLALMLKVACDPKQINEVLWNIFGCESYLTLLLLFNNCKWRIEQLLSLAQRLETR